MERAKSLNSPNLEISGISKLAGSPEISEKRELQDSGGTFRNVESQKFLDDEIVKLMSKDYPGNTPRRPPINNNQPLNGENAMP